MVLATVSLFFQLLPTVWTGLVGVLDVREWGQLDWFIANLVVVIVFLGIAYGPQVQIAWAESRAAAEKKRHKKATMEKREEKYKRAEESRARRNTKIRHY